MITNLCYCRPKCCPSGQYPNTFPGGTSSFSHRDVYHYPHVSSSDSLWVASVSSFFSLTLTCYSYLCTESQNVCGCLRSVIPCSFIMVLNRGPLRHALPTSQACRAADRWSSQTSSLSRPQDYSLVVIWQTHFAQSAHMAPCKP